LQARQPQRIQVDGVALSRRDRPAVHEGVHPRQRPWSTVDDQKALRIDADAGVRSVVDGLDDVEAGLLEPQHALTPGALRHQGRGTNEEERGVDGFPV